MGWLDGLSSALTAGTQGAAGYLEGQDKGRLEAQARARQIALDLLAKRKQQEEETMGAANRANLLQDNQLNALKAGYLPVGQLRQEAAQTGGIANTGAAGLSGAANIGSGGIDLSFIQPTVAKLAGRRSTELRQGSETPVKIGDQEFGFDFNRSLEGRQLQRMQDVQTMKDVEAQRKQTEAASLAAGVADRRNRASHGTLVQDFKHTQPYNPDVDYAASLTDERARRQIDAGQREKWLTNPLPDADGNFVQTSDRGGFRILNGRMGQKPGAGAGGSTGQSQGARLLGAMSEGQLAIKRMNAFEDNHTRPDGSLNVNTVQQIVGNLTGLNPHQGVTTAVVQGTAEGEANRFQSDYQQYVRDAKLIARAEQLMAARGGSEAMASGNELLARGGANASEATLSAARKSRGALFGDLGAVMQTMSPAQIEKLYKGLNSLKDRDDKTDYLGLGREIFGGGGGGLSHGVDMVTQAKRDAWNKMTAAEKLGRTPPP